MTWMLLYLLVELVPKEIPCPLHHTRIQLEQEVALYDKADFCQTLSISGSRMMLNMILLFVIYPHFWCFVGVKHHYSEQNPSGDHRERNLEHWQAGSAVKSADYSCRGPKAWLPAPTWRFTAICDSSFRHPLLASTHLHSGIHAWIN